jgi:hypothetical protein
MASGLIPLGLLFIFTLGKIYKARGKQEEKSKIEIKEKEEINFLKREKKSTKMSEVNQEEKMLQLARAQQLLSFNSKKK